MNNTDPAAMESRYDAAYDALDEFEDTPNEDPRIAEDRLISGYPREEQFRIDLVLWTVERLRRMGRPVDAAWLMHELLFFCAHIDAFHRDLDSFIEETILGQLYERIVIELEHDQRARDEISRITDTVLALIESVQ